VSIVDNVHYHVTVLQHLVYNFNPERIAICAASIRSARICYEDSWNYSHKRKTFGKRLIDHPVIRQKLAHMARQIESSQNWLESLVYQTKVMSREESNKRLGGAIALFKVQVGVTFDYCAREASQIFGGLAYTRTGQGERIERLYRDVKFTVIAGGSEEIMADLGIKQAMLQYKNQGKKT
jgi:alkylation response protein AidB-like acyl-CoA dehydrogenase